MNPADLIPSVDSGLIALRDQLDDPASWPMVGICAHALEAELRTSTQRGAFAAFLFELADSIGRSFP